MGEALGGEEEVAGCDALAEREGCDQCCHGRDHVGLGESRDGWLDSAAGRLRDCHDVAGFRNGVIAREGCRSSGFVVLEDVVPDADLESALS